MPVTDLSILLEVSHATHFHTKKEQYVFRRIYIFSGDGPSASVYVLVAIIKNRLKIETSLYNILQVLSLTLFEKISLIQLLDKSYNNPMFIDDSIQLTLFDNFLGHWCKQLFI
jgi:hypothetical protein